MHIATKARAFDSSDANGNHPSCRKDSADIKKRPAVCSGALVFLFAASDAYMFMIEGVMMKMISFSSDVVN
jgi:hypothetical protein